jgi:glycerol-3-phosphate dehydrogenase
VFDRQRKTDPALNQRDAITYFSGVRAATYEEDFVIRKANGREISFTRRASSPPAHGGTRDCEDVSLMAKESWKANAR